MTQRGPLISPVFSNSSSKSIACFKAVENKISVKLFVRLFEAMAERMNVNMTFVAFHPSSLFLILSCGSTTNRLSVDQGRGGRKKEGDETIRRFLKRLKKGSRVLVEGSGDQSIERGVFRIVLSRLNVPHFGQESKRCEVKKREVGRIDDWKSREYQFGYIRWEWEVKRADVLFRCSSEFPFGRGEEHCVGKRGKVRVLREMR